MRASRIPGSTGPRQPPLARTVRERCCARVQVCILPALRGGVERHHRQHDGGEDGRLMRVLSWSSRLKRRFGPYVLSERSGSFDARGRTDWAVGVGADQSATRPGRDPGHHHRSGRTRARRRQDSDVGLPRSSHSVTASAIRRSSARPGRTAGAVEGLLLRVNAPGANPTGSSIRCPPLQLLRRPAITPVIRPSASRTSYAPPRLQ